MRCEVPDVKRCCLCLPLRCGILTFGYLNLVFSIFVIVIEIRMNFSPNPMTSISGALYRGVSMYVQMWFAYLLYILEVIFDIVLLVGAHTKKHHLVRIYYYYGILTTVATTLAFVTMFAMYYTESTQWYWIWLEYCFAFSGFVLQAYLLLLIRTEMKKLKELRKGNSYQNQMTEVFLDPPLSGDERNFVY